MSHTLKAYEIGQYYDEIMNNIIKQKPICRNYFCQKNEPNVNQILQEELSKVIDRMHETIYKIITVEYCFQHEMDRYDKQETLSDIDKIDYQACKGCRWQLWNIEHSFRKTQCYLKGLKYKLSKMNISVNSPVLRAIRYECKKCYTRCKDCFQNVITEYILKSIMRPYYIHITNKGIDLTEEIKKHTLPKAPSSYEELLAKFEPYINYIVAFGEKSGKTVYKSIRIEEFQKNQAYIDQTKERRKQEKEAKTQEQYKERIQKFCIQRETVYDKKRKDGKQHPIFSQLMKADNYDKQAKTCCIIVCLCKPEKGNAYYRYYDTNCLRAYSQEITTFFFDNIGIQDAITKCYTYPDVKAVDSIRIY